MLLRFLKNWTLPVSMVSGALTYFVCRELPLSADTRGDILHSVEILQPLLLFCMLYIAFCKVKPSEMRPRKWQAWILLTQSLLFTLCCVIMHFLGENHAAVHYALEAFLLAIICPTATACAVVTQKLGGDSATTTTYTIIINLTVAVLIPLLLPLTHIQSHLTFLTAFSAIITKVFPLLMLPLFLAWATRYLLPSLHAKILSVRDLAFYLWAVSLAIAIAITCKALVHSNESLLTVFTIAVATLIACILQFSFGRWIGSKYGFSMEAGQAMGQKNTIFIIWLGYTFLCPISATAGGFYSVWHNIVNSWQLYRKRKNEASFP